MFLNKNAKTEKSPEGITIFGLELLPHRMAFLLLSDKEERETRLMQAKGIAMRWNREIIEREGPGFHANFAIPLLRYIDELHKGDRYSWRLLERHNACPGASEACKASCLAFSGFGTMPGTIAKRLARTLAFIASPSLFIRELHREIEKEAKKASKKGETLGIRLNVFSDHVWEKIAPDLFNIEGVQFYDYTKLRPSVRKDRPSNYYLTQSWTDTDTEERLSERLSAGNLAVPFLTGKNGRFPEYYRGLPVIDGDSHDYRPADPAGVIVGLRVKGKAGSRPTENAFGEPIA